MNLTIIGTTFSALTVASCLSKIGHNIVFVCLNKEVLKLENQEESLKILFNKQTKTKALKITSEIEVGLKHSNWVFFYFKSNEFNFAEKIAKNKQDKIIVNGSTFALGSAKKLSNKNILVFPDFMIEGKMITSFIKPDRIIIGGLEKLSQELAQILKPLNQNEKIIFMSIASAELTKLATNAMLATRVSFINEIAQISSLSGADITQVTQGLGSDKRIGFDYLNAGIGFGGFSLDIDVQGLLKSAKHFGCLTPTLESILISNKKQKEVLFRQLWQYFSMDLKDKKVCLWGLSYKVNSADITNAPSLGLIEVLLSQEAKVVVYDKLASCEIKNKYPAVEVKEDCLEALENCDALFILTEHEEFKQIDFAKMHSKMKQAIIFDGRNIYDPKKMKKQGFEYMSIGR